MMTTVGNKARYRLLVIWLLIAATAMVFFYFVPLFKIKPLQERDQNKKEVFDAAAFVDEFWHGPLKNLQEHAPDANQLLEQLNNDFQDTAKSLGNQLGVSNKHYFFIRGNGKIISVENDLVAIDITQDDDADFTIELGPVFGNVIRDGSGLLDINHFANTQEFNAISFEINRRVEEEVLTTVRSQAQENSPIKFIGAFELNNAEFNFPINLIPIEASFD